MAEQGSTDIRRLTIVVRGRVQGVWFRESTRLAASALGLVGQVRNLTSGEVEIVAEGPRNRLAALAVWARRGPDAAHVEGIETTCSAPTGEFHAFLVVR